jgi:hypothetical protein
VGLTLIIGIAIYSLWLLLSIYLSLNWQLAAGGAAGGPSAGATKWLQGGAFLIGVCCAATAVRIALRFLARQERFQHVYLTGLSVGAIVGVVSAAFLNQNLRLSSLPHLFVDVPEVSVGRFWPLVITLGMSLALIGGLVGRGTLKE